MTLLAPGVLAARAAPRVAHAARRVAVSFVAGSTRSAVRRSFKVIAAQPKMRYAAVAAGVVAPAGITLAPVCPPCRRP